MLNFKTINNSDLSLFREYFAAQDYKLCDYSVGAIFMWKDFFSAEYAVFDDFLIFRSEFNDVERCFSFPISNKDNSFQNVEKAIKKLEEHSKEQGTEVITYINVPKEALPLLEKIYGSKMKKSFEREWSDYLYHFSDLLNFEGRKYNGQRNHINKFVRNYSDYGFQEISRENHEKLKAFYEEFLKNNAAKGEIEKNELATTKIVIDEYFSLPMVGGILEIGGEIAGFSIGEIVGSTLFVHIEKANVEYKGIYPFIVKQFAELNSNKNISYINREEDVGDLGLRKSKLAYHPCELLDKYTVEISL